MWRLEVGVDRAREEELTDRLVEFNKAQSAVVAERFRPANLKSEPVHVFAVDEAGALLGGCAGRVERIWYWLTVDTMWVDPGSRRRGVGSALLAAIEDEGRQRGCRWSDVTTFDFQAPGFYLNAGYVEYGVKRDYPPGHSNHLLRKDL